MEDEVYDVVLYKKEQKAIERLRKCLATFPKTLKLFGWSGTLCVMKEDADGTDCLIDQNFAVDCDGGDPDDINQDPEIDYK